MLEQKPPPQSQQAIGQDFVQHLRNVENTKKYKVKEILEEHQSKLEQFDILNEIPKFVNNISNLKKSKLEDIVYHHKSQNQLLTQPRIVNFKF